MRAKVYHLGPNREMPGLSPENFDLKQKEIYPLWKTLSFTPNSCTRYYLVFLTEKCEFCSNLCSGHWKATQPILKPLITAGFLKYLWLGDYVSENVGRNAVCTLENHPRTPRVLLQLSVKSRGWDSSHSWEKGGSVIWSRNPKSPFPSLWLAVSRQWHFWITAWIPLMWEGHTVTGANLDFLFLFCIGSYLLPCYDWLA